MWRLLSQRARLLRRPKKCARLISVLFRCATVAVFWGFLRGLFFEGWQPSNAPIAMSRQEFLEAVSEKIVTDHAIDPLRITQIVFSVIISHVGIGEMEKIKHCFSKDIRTLWAGWA